MSHDHQQQEVEQVRNTGHAGHDAHGDHADRHAGHGAHGEVFRQKFWISLALSVPVVVFSHMFADLLGYTVPRLPRCVVDSAGGRHRDLLLRRRTVPHRRVE